MVICESEIVVIGDNCLFFFNSSLHKIQSGYFYNLQPTLFIRYASNSKEAFKGLDIRSSVNIIRFLYKE